MIKYIGSKRLLVPRIVSAVASLPDVRVVLDLFSGTARVGHALKRSGYFVIANDHNAYAHTLARCYVQADADRVARDAERLIGELSSVPPRAGYFTEQFCVHARFFHPRNGERIDAIRDEIARKGLEPDLEAVLLASLMEAADRVDSTAGVQMAYLKRWAPRALNPLDMRLPHVLPGSGRALHLDAVDAAHHAAADLAYLDPPYNQHSYLGNYHIWETLVRWDRPEVYGVARKRVDCARYSSPFNSRRRIGRAMAELLSAVRARYLIVSFNNEGYLAREEIEAMLASYGHVGVVRIDYKRYVGAQIGIYNPSGRKVGTVSHLRNEEYLYLVAPDRERLQRMVDGAGFAYGSARE